MNLKHTEKIALRGVGMNLRRIREIQQQEAVIVNMERRIEELMSEQEYDIEREKLRETYGSGGSSIEARAKADMALSKLYVLTGWTRERLAEKEGMTRDSVFRKLIFGRFLNSDQTLGKALPQNLTERRFRSYWIQTADPKTLRIGMGQRDSRIFNEEGRFEQVARLLEEDTVARQQNRPKIGKDVAEAFSDGKWHDVAEIAAKVEAPEDHVEATLIGMRDKHTYGHKAEQREIGKVMKFRIFREAQKVGTDEMIEKLAPFLKSLREQGKANMATMSPAAVAYATAMIQKQIDEWADKPAAETGLRKVAL